jgi:hypothetical protein
MFGPQTDYIVGRDRRRRRRRRRRLERKLHNKELHNFYACPNIIGIKKSSRTKLAEIFQEYLKGKEL